MATFSLDYVHRLDVAHLVEGSAKWGALHGHSIRATVRLMFEDADLGTLPGDDEVEACLRPIFAAIDGTLLNVSLGVPRPDAAALAFYLFRKCRALPCYGDRLSSIEVAGCCGASAVLSVSETPPR